MVALVLSTLGHGYLPGLFRFLLWLWPIAMVSVLVGIAIQEGRIHSVDDPITRYLPELRHTAWEGVTLHQLMQHTSGGG